MIVGSLPDRGVSGDAEVGDVVYSASHPCWAASLTISTRVRSPSFSATRALYVSTVLTLKDNSLAIALLLNPFAIRISTSRSRSLQSPEPFCVLECGDR